MIGVVSCVINHVNIIAITKNQHSLFLFCPYSFYSSRTNKNLYPSLFYFTTDYLTVIEANQSYRCKIRSLKDRFFKSSCWSQLGRWTYFLKMSNWLKLSQNRNLICQSSVITSRERWVIDANILISLLGTYSSFGRTTRCLSLSWSLWLCSANYK